MTSCCLWIERSLGSGSSPPSPDHLTSETLVYNENHCAPPRSFPNLLNFPLMSTVPSSQPHFIILERCAGFTNTQALSCSTEENVERYSHKTSILRNIFTHALKRAYDIWWFQFENKCTLLFVQFELLSFLVGTGLSYPES